MKQLIQISFICLLVLLSVISCNWPADTNHDIRENVVFNSGKFNVSGELLLPKGEAPFPLVIMVHGDGPAYMTYFSTIKNSMLKAGYATLMWDKPGFGKSTGAFSKKHLREERAEILIDALSVIRDHPKIKADKIGVWGISQASYVIPMAIEKDAKIKFMILVGAGGENGINQTAYLIKQQLICVGISEKEAEKAEDDFIKLYRVKTYEAYLSHAKPLVENPTIKKLGFVSAIWPEDQWKPYTGTEEGFYDPIDVFETTTIPSLVFFGDLDKNVDPVQGVEAYKNAFIKARNPNYKVVLINGSDHNIIISETGCKRERMSRSGKEWSNYDPQYLKQMEDWLTDLE